MKILVIATGGTIGSVFDGVSIDVSAAQSCAVVEMYKKEHNDADFVTQSPLNLLSERISADDLNILARVILTTDYAPYDGVIFTCGSDNLGYLAPFIGLLTADLSIPVMIVVTDRVPSDPAANGYPNFCAAVGLIRRGKNGSYVPYRNLDGIMYIHSATDIRQADLSDDFLSFHGAYAVCGNDNIILKKNYIQQTIPAVFSSDNLPKITDNVALIHPYPLLDYSLLKLDGKRAVLHTLYHSSTLDSEGAIPLMKHYSGIPFYLASFRSEKNRYITAVEAIDAGAIPLTDISPECAYIKLLLACSQDTLSIREFMGE